ncbi:MAG: M48 family metallopeptidase, partial [Hyphomicrobiales bacterium]
MPVSTSQPIPTPSQPPVFRAVYFDGQTAAAQIATASLGTDTLRLDTAQSEVMDQFVLADLYRSATTPDQFVIAAGGDHDGRRIVVERAELPPEVWVSLQMLPDRPHASSRQPLRFMLACLAFIVACLAIFTILIPAVADRLAPFVPRSFEQTLGQRLERIVLQVGQHNICGSSANDDHLLALAGRLRSASEAIQPVSIHIIDLPDANAFALPSGRIYVTRALLALTRTPDELTAILAHEMGHVQAHHALRLSLRVGGSSAALGFLLGDFTGSTAVYAIGQTLIGTAFSREFEREADELSVPIM